MEVWKYGSMSGKKAVISQAVISEHTLAYHLRCHIETQTTLHGVQLVCLADQALDVQLQHRPCVGVCVCVCVGVCVGVGVGVGVGFGVGGGHSYKDMRRNKEQST